MKDISLESGAKAVGRECSSWFSEYSFQRREALEGERPRHVSASAGCLQPFEEGQHFVTQLAYDDESQARAQVAAHGRLVNNLRSKNSGAREAESGF